MASLDLNRPLFISLPWMSPHFRFLLWVLPVLTGASVSGAVSLDELVKSSPFMPAGQESVPVAPTENAAVEFRGMITTPTGVLFGLYDRTKQTGAWVGKDEKDADFVVKSYDPASDMLSVDYHGQKFNLTLSSSKIGSAAPSVPFVVAGAPGTRQAGGVTPAVARVDDQRRLEAIAAEVRRRRALRQSAASGAAAQPTAQSGGTRR